MSDLTPQSAAVLGPIIYEKIANHESVLLTVTGHSMTPTFKDRRDAVVLQGLTQWPPPRGTILFIQRPQGKYVLHRVIRVVGQHVILNGDGQVWMEGPIDQSQAIARGTLFRRRGRYRSVDAWGVRLYSRIWMALRPLRRQAFALYRAVKGLRHRKK